MSVLRQVKHAAILNDRRAAVIESGDTMDIHDYLRNCRDLSALCSQNGWIDNDTLEVQIMDARPGQVLAAVQFDEVIMEGAGCIAGRVPCFGQVRMRVDGAGNVLGMDIRR